MLVMPSHGLCLTYRDWWRTRVFHFIFVITFDVCGMVGTTSGCTAASIALRIIWPHKSCDYVKAGTPSGRGGDCFRPLHCCEYLELIQITVLNLYFASWKLHLSLETDMLCVDSKMTWVKICLQICFVHTLQFYEARVAVGLTVRGWKLMDCLQFELTFTHTLMPTVTTLISSFSTYGITLLDAFRCLLCTPSSGAPNLFLLPWLFLSIFTTMYVFVFHDGLKSVTCTSLSQFSLNTFTYIFC
jgi:hypothetical protein